jgi:hypothetical protein
MAYARHPSFRGEFTGCNFSFLKLTAHLTKRRLNVPQPLFFDANGMPYKSTAFDGMYQVTQRCLFMKNKCWYPKKRTYSDAPKGLFIFYLIKFIDPFLSSTFPSVSVARNVYTYTPTGCGTPLNLPSQPGRWLRLSNIFWPH